MNDSGGPAREAVAAVAESGWGPRRGQEVMEARALAGGHVARNRHKHKEERLKLTGSVRLRTMPAWAFT
jgi:hypothetical protein